MNVPNLIREAERRREATDRRQEIIRRLQVRLRVTKDNTITDGEFADFAHRVLRDEELVAVFNELADGRTKIAIGDRPARRDNISLEEDGTLFIHHKIPLDIIRSFLELNQTKASA